MARIYNRFTDEIMFEDENKTVKELCEENKANLASSNLARANLARANLVRANLKWANLVGANLDFSCLPLSCGGLYWKIDRKLFVQILYHLCSMQVDDEEITAWQQSNYNLANEMHRRDVERLE